MASIAAPPTSFSDGLKKRARLLSATESYEMPSRMKRCRGAGEYGAIDGGGSSMMTEEEANKDVPKYTQRHVDFFEQKKQAEIARIRTEYEQYIMKKEMEFAQFRQDYVRIQEQSQAQDREIQRLQGENKLLKRAITIQNQQKEECQQENAVLKNVTSQAADHIRRLEQANYALRVHLQASTSSGPLSSSNSQHPDVY